ncbi:MAG: nucleotidyltransferase domain-containing protein [Nitrococcus sp.]|nr:nucleotidyltransferase domain-containing protein [Nitrococcus sp.]
MKDHQPNAVAQLADFLAAQKDIRLGLLFGSLASGKAGQDSDVDIAILCDHPLNVERRIELIEDLACLTGRAVDLVDLATAGIAVVRSAVLGGRVLYSRDSAAYPTQITRMLLDSADFLPYRERLLRQRLNAWIR